MHQALRYAATLADPQVHLSFAGSAVVDLPAPEARHRMGELIDLLEDGRFIYFTRRGKRVAALMPADIAENYEKIEDDYQARRAADEGGEESVPWGQAITELEGGGR